MRWPLSHRIGAWGLTAQVFDKPWRCVATATGPLRATATIVSTPFEYRCRDVDAKGEVGPVDLWFSPRYFMLLNLTFGPVTSRYPNHPGWFAVGATRVAHAAHIFRRDTNQQELTDAAGWTWYDLAFKPLRAKL